ncbi:MAG: GIY-YIG nuclease family protein [Phycisphaeraceae bacterium]
MNKGTEFPDWNTFKRQFGGKPELVSKLRDFCQAHPEYASVDALCNAYVARIQNVPNDEVSGDEQMGYVYLIKHGGRREYKIGRTSNPLRREGEIGIELPEKVQPVHVISTDDPSGIEAYWHNRFAAKRKNGEWFELSAEDVAAFKRRKFM